MSAQSHVTPHRDQSDRTALPPPRIVIEAIDPEVDGGRFPIKRIPGEEVVVNADIFADSHNVLRAVIRYRRVGDAAWQEAEMSEVTNDRWVGRFTVTEIGRYEYTLQGWIDSFLTWRRDLGKKLAAAQDVQTELLEGAQLLRDACGRAAHTEAGEMGVAWLRERADFIEGTAEPALRANAALEEQLIPLMMRFADRSRAASLPCARELVVDRERALRGAWYEMFPRSCTPEHGRHGTFRDAIARLPYIASLGFDVVYLPPIHPIGQSFRKGPNNALEATDADPGSPWAIGAADGGHTAVHADLGTLEDFDHFVSAARQIDLEVALDFAIQCSPDHPWVKEHPGWFRHRPDGTIKYAENPPKKYQDIYPLDFECDDWQGLWQALKECVLFWIEHGVLIFRVDNPHTKTFGFWEWMIREVQARHPEAIFLAEAFTRPKVMKYLAKSGFSQSYTYFTWKNSKAELTEYFTELAQSPVREFMRPNVFANTPDILHEYLQSGGRPAFISRLVLAATLSATYGIYGPPYELCENLPVHAGSEEYLDSEKFQIRHWDLDRPGNIRDIVTRMNKIRRENRALHSNRNLRFYPVDNDELIFYGKGTSNVHEMVLVVVNLDPFRVHSGWVRVPLYELGLGEHDTYQVHDLINGARYNWRGEVNFVQLDPTVCPAHVFRVVR